MGDMVTVPATAPFVRKRLTGVLLRYDPARLEMLAGLLDAGGVRPVVECTRALAECRPRSRR
jgi:hypothetical protein